MGGGFVPGGEAEDGAGTEFEFGRDEFPGGALPGEFAGSGGFVAEPEGFGAERDRREVLCQRPVDCQSATRQSECLRRRGCRRDGWRCGAW